MAKMLNYPRITVETDEEVFVFRAVHATISSTDGGETHQLEVTTLIKHEHRAANTEYPTSPTATGPLKVKFWSSPETVVSESVQKLEEGKLQTAMEAQEVRLRHTATVEKLKHNTNKAILTALHTGISAEALNKALEEAGYSGYMDRIELVRDNDFDVLYGARIVQ